MTKLPHDALVFIGDGRKALFLRNAGDADIPDLRTEQVFKEDNPPTREQGTDKPGRGFASAGSPRRSGMEETAPIDSCQRFQWLRCSSAHRGCGKADFSALSHTESRRKARQSVTDA
jgi:protein required for attachment to host cells